MTQSDVLEALEKALHHGEKQYVLGNVGPNQHEQFLEWMAIIKASITPAPITGTFKCPDCNHGINVSHRGCNLSKTAIAAPEIEQPTPCELQEALEHLEAEEYLNDGTPHYANACNVYVRDIVVRLIRAHAGDAPPYLYDPETGKISAVPPYDQSLFVLVPREPTQHMIDEISSGVEPWTDENVIATYKAMISAAPPKDDTCA